jgi:hypothetical protein
MAALNLYRLTPINLPQAWARHYDSFYGAIVAARDARDAATIHPRMTTPESHAWESESTIKEWAPSPQFVKTTLIGVATTRTRRGVIFAGFNDG